MSEDLFVLTERCFAGYTFAQSAAVGIGSTAAMNNGGGGGRHFLLRVPYSFIFRDLVGTSRSHKISTVKDVHKIFRFFDPLPLVRLWI